MVEKLQFMRYDVISIRYQIKLKSCYVVAQIHTIDSENNPVLPDIRSQRWLHVDRTY